MPAGAGFLYSSLVEGIEDPGHKWKESPSPRLLSGWQHSAMCLSGSPGNKSLN